MRTLITAALLLLSSLPLSTASAQVGDQDRARLHFQAGASYYEAGDYEDALREFQRSYELSQKPELFYNLSLCYQQLGDLEQAASFLERYLAEVADIPNRPNLERRLENFRERMARQAQQSDGGETGEGHETSGEAGEGHETGDEGQATDQASGGGSSASEASDEPDVAGGGAADHHTVAEGGGANVPAIIGFSVAGVGALMLGVSGGLAMAKRSELDDAGCSPNCPSSDVSSLRRRAAFADVGLGLAVAGAALGVVFLVVGGGNDDDAEARRVRVEPYAGRHSAGASIRGQF